MFSKNSSVFSKKNLLNPCRSLPIHTHLQPMPRRRHLHLHYESVFNGLLSSIEYLPFSDCGHSTLYSEDETIRHYAGHRARHAPSTGHKAFRRRNSTGRTIQNHLRYKGSVHHVGVCTNLVMMYTNRTLMCGQHTLMCS